MTLNTPITKRVELLVREHEQSKTFGLSKANIKNLKASIQQLEQPPVKVATWNNLFNTLQSVLIDQSDDENRLKIIRILGERLLELLIKRWVQLAIMGSSDSITTQMLEIISISVQYTNRVNLACASFFEALAMKKILNAPFESIKNLKANPDGTKRLLETIYRLLEAQRWLSNLWDCSHLFSIDQKQLDQQIEDNHTKFLILYLQQMISPDNQRAQQLEQFSLDHIQKLDHNLRINQVEERRRESELDKLMGVNEDDYSLMPTLQEIAPNTGSQKQSTQQENSLVESEYLKDKINQMQSEMECDLFRHFAVFGDPSSGKISLVNLLNQRFNQQYSKLLESPPKLIVVTLEQTFDSKNLVGTYVCNETGEFVFKKGPLTVAADNGYWLVLRNIEQTPADLLSFLMPLVQENTLQVTSTFSITPKLGFRLFMLCQGNEAPEHVKPLLNLMNHTNLEQLENRQDFNHEILPKKFPLIYKQPDLKTLLQKTIEYINEKMQLMKSHMLDYRSCTVREMLKTYTRIENLLKQNNISEEDQQYLNTNLKMNILEEICDVYLGYLYDKSIKTKFIQGIVTDVFNTQENVGAFLDPQTANDYIQHQKRQFDINQHSCYFGRSLPIKRVQQNNENPDEELQDANQGKNKKREFVFTATTLRLLEQVCQGASHNESMLLVGETGTGKTTAVQEIAQLAGKKLHVFNMNQNTDSSDLLGGFKPIDMKFLLKPVYEQFLDTFLSYYKREKNQQFLDLLQKCFENNKIKEFIQCLHHGLKSIKTKEKAEQLEHQINELQKRSQKLESGGGFIFQFIEGTLIQSIKNGDWVLLDEINLANESVLNRLATIIDGNYILLNERADVVNTERHKDFRLFLCMNPPYTSAGKKQLPTALRAKLSEIYAPELDSETDLWMIVERNTRGGQINELQKRKILEFYMKARSEIMKQTKRAGNIGLRNLCRALQFMRCAVQLAYPVVKAIHDSLYTCFASHLDTHLQTYIRNLIFELFEITQLPQLQNTHEQQMQHKFAYVEDSIIPKGKHAPKNFKENQFILTPSFRGLLRQLASIVAVSDYAVILEGPTSAGKTSSVQYLADITHNKVIRINNHMHTDIQEYLGSYVPSSAAGSQGKLVFQEGVLVEAVRKGYWVILDELNLAPSEVLEALNRLLDDNRELHIVETQKIIKAHPNFRIFATQNPSEGYGGRKQLSEAFKNRFILIKVCDVPTDELLEILMHKCGLPKSRAILMVKVMEQLQLYRSQSNLFSGKDSTITVRDLLKWAGRVNQNDQIQPQDVAMEGFLVLGERARNPTDKAFIKQTIEKTIRGSKINEQTFYQDYFDQRLQKVFNQDTQALKNKLIFTQQFKRLAVLVHKCLMNREPVLLVGDTGCGKTTLCEIFAKQVTKQNLCSINCHQNTETSDFIGSMRTRKNLKQTQDKLSDLVEQVNQVQGLLNDDQQMVMQKTSSVKGKANFLIKVLKQHLSNSKPIVPTSQINEALKQIRALRDDLNCVFEWHDGILVQSMQEGALLLIDEISLANDAVLERLNSIFEQERTLILTEKSSQEAIKIVAHEQFNMVATMNPSGDFGKKELSPALRNRMTEIWVESYFQQDELLTLYKQASENTYKVHAKVSETIDLNMIINELCKSKLNGIIDEQNIQAISAGLFNIICFINFPLAQKHFSLQRKALSIRDILNAIDFVKVAMPIIGDVALTFQHAIELVIIDGLCLGIDVASEKQKRSIIDSCYEYMQKIMITLFGLTEQQSQMISGITSKGDLVDTLEQIGVKPFTINKKLTESINQNVGKQFAFEAETTRVNLMKLLRAYTLDKPVLIEGPPGVGKTALVENLARASGRTLIRVNLSEQTDMMDLLGSEYPVPSTSTGDQGAAADQIQFAWSDGQLLTAIKKGYWFLIDEMNLAQQSILEGLNAILDHRKTVYIPELNKEFVCHKDFFVFACQNPSQSSSSVGGRKTLPKSFLNRFNKIYLEELTQQDYQCILKKQVKFDELSVDNLLEFSKKMEFLIKSDSLTYSEEGAINMRDLSRMLNLYSEFRTNQACTHELSLMQSIQICYLQRINQSRLQAFDLVREYFFPDFSDANRSALVRILPQENALMFKSLKQTKLQLNTNTFSLDLKLSDILALKGSHSLQLQFLIDCMQANLPILAVTNQPDELVANLRTLAKLSQQNAVRILLNERSDTTQLLGCFEQTAQDYSQIIKSISGLKTSPSHRQLISAILHLEHQLRRKPDNAYKLLKQFISKHSDSDLPNGISQQLSRVHQLQEKGATAFDWVDSVLVQAIEFGHWAIFENANLCNASILDRLNPLLEEGKNSLSMNEQGLVGGSEQIREVQLHKNFRSIFIINEKTLQQGKDVSRALRNRCLQLTINYTSSTNTSSVLESESTLLEGQKMVDLDYMQLKHDVAPFNKYISQEQEIPEQLIFADQQQEHNSASILGKRRQSEQSSTSSLIAHTANLSLNQLEKANNGEDSKQSNENKDLLQSYIFNLIENNNDMLSKVALYFKKTFINGDKHCEDIMNFLKAEHNFNKKELYLRFLISFTANKIVELIQDKNSNFIVPLAIRPLFDILISQSPSEIQLTEDNLLLLRGILNHLQQGDAHINQSNYLVYLMGQVYGSGTSSEFESLTKVLNSCSYEDDRTIIKFLLESAQDQTKNFDPLIALGASKFSLDQVKLLKQWHIAFKEIEDQPVQIWIDDLSGNNLELNSVVKYGFEGLRNYFSLILLNEDKEILKKPEDWDAVSLEELLDSPYLVMIPRSKTSCILLSQSYLYPSLCMVKDLTKLAKNSTGGSNKLDLATLAQSFKRLSQIPIESKLLAQLSQGNSEQATFVRNLCIMNLETQYMRQHSSSFEQVTMQAILQDEQSICVRDMPSFFSCATQLIAELKTMSSNSYKFESKLETIIEQDPKLVELIQHHENNNDKLIQMFENLQTLTNQNINDNLEAKEQAANVLKCLLVLDNIDTMEVIKALFVLPLETARCQGELSLKKQWVEQQLAFLNYHYKENEQPNLLAQQKFNEISQLEKSLSELERLQIKTNNKQLASNEQQAQNSIRQLLSFAESIIQVLLDTKNYLFEKQQDGSKLNSQYILSKSALLNQLLTTGFELYFGEFNHVLTRFFNLTLELSYNIQKLVYHITKNNHVINIQNSIVTLRQKTNLTSIQYLEHAYLQAKTAAHFNKKLGLPLYEHQMLWLLQLFRLQQENSTEIQTSILDYFVRREVTKKLAQESRAPDERTFEIPFKMTEQDLMLKNKAIDEKTKEDIEKEKKEQEKEIEENFPSYFDEFQKTMFGAKIDDQNNNKLLTCDDLEPVSIKEIMQEILTITEPSDKSYKSAFLQERLKISMTALQIQSSDADLLISEREISHWTEDASAFLTEQLESNKMKSVLNISDVQLNSSYNFYFDTIQEEARLVYQPLLSLQERIRDLLDDDYESPILCDALFLCNYMLTTFNTKNSPLMKLLTGMEMILNKLEEWEQFASKKLNSCENEIIQLKQLVIRYRKIQILSWRNLLSYYKKRMITNDFENCLRLAHTIERQVFDKALYRKSKTTGKKSKYELSVELKVFELLDLFIRDSSLGVYQSRLNFFKQLYSHLKLKFKLLTKQREPSRLVRFNAKLTFTAEMEERLTKILNVLNFVYNYYSQFSEQLQKTILRLDTSSRDKVKTLIDVSKWSVQKFVIVKSNIDKTHRQLNKACKDEEQILMQNVQSLVLVSSRKKYLEQQDQLTSLDQEKLSHSRGNSKIIKLEQEEAQSQLLHRIGLMERTMIETRWPSSQVMEQSMAGFLERLVTVREINKKNYQRRAFIDLLKFLKDQGLRPNFQEDLQPLMLDSKLFKFSNQAKNDRLTKYFFKSHELMLVLNSSSEQEDGKGDLRAVDIQRIKGFTQSLMQKILLINKELKHLQKAHKQLNKVAKLYAQENDEQEFLCGVNQTKVTTYQNLRRQFFTLVTSIQQKIKLTSLLTGIKINQFEDTRLVDRLESTVPMWLSQSSLNTFKKQIESILSDLQLHVIGLSERLDLSINDTIEQLEELSDKLDELASSQGQETESASEQINKKVTLLQKYVQLLYQDSVKLLDKQEQDKKEDQTMKDEEKEEENDEEEDDSRDLTIQEQQDFLNEYSSQVIGDKFQKLTDLATKLFKLRGIDENQSLSKEDLSQFTTAHHLVTKATNLLSFVIENQGSYLTSLCKLSYLSQRVFLYILYQGLCGQDDSEEQDQDQQAEDDQYLEQDGCGMGDGEGGQQNVSNQIEHEEQVEGLKNYESDQEQEKQEKNEQQEEEEDDNHFDMENDFDGQMEDVEQNQDEENKKDENEDKEDDELDQVDDELDNQLWNKNLEDMEQKEEENNEKEKNQEKRELDLGERELDEQNQIKQDEKELAAGDFEDQEMQERKDDPDQKEDEPEREDEISHEGGEEDKNDDDQGDEEDENDPNKVPLDRDEVIQDDVQDVESQTDNEDDDKDKKSDENQEDEENKEDNQEMLEQEGFEDQGDRDMSDQEDGDDNKDDEQDDQLDTRRDQDQNVLENDKIESKHDKDNKQANLKKQNQGDNLNQQQNDNEEQQQKAQEQQQTQFDVQGSDILYQMAQKIEQKQKEKEKKQDQKAQQPPPASEMPEENQDIKDSDKIRQPNEDEEKERPPAADPNEGDEAMEYEVDDQAEQMQGRLGTDQVQEQQHQTQNEDEVMHDESDANVEQQEDGQEDNPEENIQKTNVAQQDNQPAPMQNANEKQQNKDKNVEEVENEEENVNPENQEELIDMYNQYLEQKVEQEQQEDAEMKDEQEDQAEMLKDSKFTMDLDDFDYAIEKQNLRQLFEAWLREEQQCQQSIALLNKFKQQTNASAASLCEQLRIVLEPQLSQQLQGDYKTGKRLNMKKVISFIASHYRNDKIWLRRTAPSARDYKILIAIDDSLSMKENNLGFFSLEAMVTILEALNRLEVGKVAVARVRDRLELVQSFEDSYSNQRNAFMLSQFNFEHCAPRSSDYALANFMKDSNALLDTQNTATAGAMNTPFVIVLSDGRFNKDNVREYVREAKEKNYLYIFVVLDKLTTNKQGKDNGGILSMRSAVKQPNGQIKLTAYMQDFPFDYYVIIRDIEQLPNALGTILVQWFTMANK